MTIDKTSDRQDTGQPWWRRDVAVAVSLGLAGYSILVYGLVWLFDFHQPPPIAVDDFKPYFAKPNWYGYPLFFVLLVPALASSWLPFVAAWRRLAETGVLTKERGIVDDDILHGLELFIRSRRSHALWLALGLSLVVTVVDVQGSYQAFAADSYPEQLELACKDKSFFTKWLFDAWADRGGDVSPCHGTVPAAEAVRQLLDSSPALADLPQVAANVALHLQQFAITTLAALAGFQVLFHTWWFARFDQERYAIAHGLRVCLNPASPLKEFGLEHWNHALNNFYWAMAPALVAPFISRATVPDPSLLAPGQRMFNIFVPLAVLAPMVATIIARQMKLPAVWDRLKPGGPCDPELYLEQRLWPLDQNWSSKLGIILAFAGAGLVLGIEISDIISL